MQHSDDVARTTYHVLPRKKGWAVFREGARRASSVHPTHDEAVRQARRYAAKQPPSRVVLHEENGATQEAFMAKDAAPGLGVGEPYSSLRLARSLNLEGPPDWSARLDYYLYGTDDDDAE